MTASRESPAAARDALSDSARGFRVVALMAAYNEGDLIVPVLEHLIGSGVDVYLLDHHSTDDTVEKARRFLGRGLLAVETFPEQSGFEAEHSDRLAWRQIILRKEELALELDADWFIQHDADELRDGPFPGLSLAEAIRCVDRLGYNAIDFKLFNFRPIDDLFRDGDDPAAHFRLYEDGDEFDKVQIKCWKKGSQPASLVPSGGHDATFPGRRVFPFRFLLRHYPFRGQTHGERKVFGERKNRFVSEERERRWHVQYDAIEPGHNFLHDPARLKRFDLDAARIEALLESAPYLELAERSTARENVLAAELEGERISRRAEVKGLREFIATREHELSQLRAEACQREETYRGIGSAIEALTREVSTRQDAARARQSELEASLASGLATLRQATAHAYHERRKLESVLLFPLWRRLGALFGGRTEHLGEITPGRSIEQRIEVSRRGWSGVVLELGTFGRANACRLAVRVLRDVDGVPLRSASIEAWHRESDGPVEIRFEPIDETGRFRLSVESPDGLPGAAVTVLTKPGDGLTVDGTELAKSLRYSLSFDA